jgi:hypothetical protein
MEISSQVISRFILEKNPVMMKGVIIRTYTFKKLIIQITNERYLNKIKKEIKNYHRENNEVKIYCSGKDAKSINIEFTTFFKTHKS